MQDTTNTTTHMELSPTQLQNSRPIFNRGVYFAGPILLREGKPRSTNVIDYYIAIIVCIVTNAVHIEVVTSSTTEVFLLP